MTSQEHLLISIWMNFFKQKEQNQVGCNNFCFIQHFSGRAVLFQKSGSQQLLVVLYGHMKYEGMQYILLILSYILRYNPGSIEFVLSNYFSDFWIQSRHCSSHHYIVPNLNTLKEVWHVPHSFLHLPLHQICLVSGPIEHVSFIACCFSCIGLSVSLLHFISRWTVFHFTHTPLYFMTN